MVYRESTLDHLNTGSNALVLISQGLREGHKLLKVRTALVLPLILSNGSILYIIIILSLGLIK